MVDGKSETYRAAHAERVLAMLFFAMNIKTIHFMTLLIVLVLGCLSINCGRLPSVPTSQTTLASPASPCPSATLNLQIEEIARSTGGPVGVAISLLEGGEVTAINGQQHFPMQSVYKLPIGMAVLQQIDEGRLRLEQKITIKPDEFVRIGQHSPIRDKNPRGANLALGEILRYAVSESDGTASDMLMRVAGGAGAVRQYLHDLGIEEIMVVDTEKEIGRSVEVQYRNWATPEAAVALMKAVAQGRGLSPESHRLLLKLITETPTGLKRIKGQLPPGTVVAHKTGTGLSEGLTRAVNDIGIVTLPDRQRLAIAIFVSDTKLDLEASETVIARISRAAWDCWTIRDAKSLPH